LRVTSVLLVDDHQLFREGLRALLPPDEYRVVGEAADARAGLTLAEERHPDLVLADVSLPGVSGISMARELVRRMPDLPIVMLSMVTDAHFVTEALSAGVRGYALKHQGIGEILDGIRAVLDGQMYFAPRVADAVAAHLGKANPRGEPGPLDSLSAREKEVFDLLVRGFTNGAIGRQLFISSKTVETHRARIMKKLQLHSLVGLLRYAVRHRLLLDIEPRT
jgi:DNA-binding NarL/FixJ family response regulator